MGSDCSLYQLILCHMLLHCQQVHILHHTVTALFPRPSRRSSPPNSHLTQHTFLCPFHMSKPFQSSLYLLNRKVFNPTHLCSLHSCFTVQHISQLAKLFQFLQHTSIYYQPMTLVSIAITITILPLSCTF